MNRHLRLNDMGEALAELSPDMVFLQEVQGRNLERALRHRHWPAQAQHRVLADRLAHHAVYGLNASYDHGHHGNALLTRFKVKEWCNRNISVNRFESRGVLQCQLQPDGWQQPVVALCGHFNLLAFDRRKQYRGLADYVQAAISEHAPLILAGDFNDWRGEASALLERELGLQEVFLQLHGSHAASFPARLPMLTLDRIYIRGLKVEKAEILRGKPWSMLSDHLPLRAELSPL
ncbi:endonuclease/exonuclease/phosphatase family protein [Chromobacterium sp. IIBBL 290-4]|nr:endonuclease/exonuclease/phosphatase family protein [Chromobacterium sp. IIBBL 290-4]UTH73291.1 endonuclease/exonuclease/phosphatase family protein [Chromobacterium sp. IIBBL 290-4]